MLLWITYVFHITITIELNFWFQMLNFFQVEYAMEAIGHAGTCLGILANDGKGWDALSEDMNDLYVQNAFIC